MKPNGRTTKREQIEAALPSTHAKLKTLTGMRADNLSALLHDMVGEGRIVRKGDVYEAAPKAVPLPSVWAYARSV